jgi:hypothetical protein
VQELAGYARHGGFTSATDLGLASNLGEAGIYGSSNRFERSWRKVAKGVAMEGEFLHQFLLHDRSFPDSYLVGF